nr:hypothetical protein [uncultured archaeon]
MKPQGKPSPQRGGVFTIATPRSDAVNVITHSRAPLSSQIKSLSRNSEPTKLYYPFLSNFCNISSIISF